MDKVLVPMVSIKEMGEHDGVREYALVSVFGPRELFYRFGEFIAVMNGNRSFLVNEVSKDDDSVFRTYNVDMEEGVKLDEQVEEDNTQDLDKVGDDIDSSKD